jgi:ABC-type uncharacterized transport system permease subunit
VDWALVGLRAALLFYAAGFVSALAPLLAGRRGPSRLTPWLAAAGAACHTLALFILGATLRRCPLGTLPEVLSAVAWASVLVALAVWWRFRAEILSLVVLPLAVIVLSISKVAPGVMLPVPETLRLPIGRFHIGSVVLGVAALTVSFGASLMYVIVDRALKSKRPAGYFRALPSLEKCDRIGLLSLMWAFPLLTLGIVTGAIYNESLTGSPWTWQARENLAILAWFILGIVVVARLGWGWRGRRAALLTICGFVLVFLRLLGL